MIQPTGIQPTQATRPLGALSAPPGLSRTAAAPPADGVTLSAAPAEAASEPVTLSRRAWLPMGLLAVAAVAGTMGALSVMQTAEPTPAPTSVSRTVETPKAVAAAPDTLAMEAPESARPELASARVGVVPAPRAFQSEQLSLVESRGVETKDVDGRQVELRWSHTGLQDARSGDLYAASDLTGALVEFQEGATSDWSAHATMQPAGNTGRFASVIVREGGQRDGGPTETVTLRTYDRESGNQVRLDDLLAPFDFEDVLSTVQGRLASSGAGAFQHAPEELKEWVAQSFSLTQDASGLTVTVAVPQAQASGSGTVAQFQFRLAPGIQL